MTFDSMDALRNYISSRSQVAVKIAQEEVYRIIGNWLEVFYGEFEPRLYDRTYQLLCSLVKSDIKPTANGWVAEVYFDLNALDYSIKTLQGIGTWENTYHRAAWGKDNDAWVLETAMTGSAPHGGYASGHAVWTESLKVLNREKREMLKRALLDAGIPVK